MKSRTCSSWTEAALRLSPRKTPRSPSWHWPFARRVTYRAKSGEGASSAWFQKKGLFRRVGRAGFQPPRQLGNSLTPTSPPSKRGRGWSVWRDRLRARDAHGNGSSLAKKSGRNIGGERPEPTPNLDLPEHRERQRPGASHRPGARGRRRRRPPDHRPYRPPP